MNADEIQALSHADLDAAIWVALAPWPDGTHQGDFMFCEFLDDCHAAEERLKEKGLKVEFVNEAIRMIPFSIFNSADIGEAMRDVTEVWFDRIHLGPRERAEAILRTMQKESA